MKSEVLKASENETNLTKSIKQRLLDYLLSKYEDSDVDELLNVCMYLDPRFKERYIKGEVDRTLVKNRLDIEKVQKWLKMGFLNQLLVPVLHHHLEILKQYLGLVLSRNVNFQVAQGKN